MVVSATWAFADATQTTHIYDLTSGSYSDQYSGPSIVGHGGTLTSSGYVQGPNQGLSLTGALDPSNYSVEMVFSMQSLSSPDGWVKLMDFKGLTSDYGLYTNGGTIWFYPTGSSGVKLSTNTANDMILTRDGATNGVVIYLNNVNIFSFTDTHGLTSLTNNVLWFMNDDQPQNLESSYSTVSLIRTYDGALSQSQVNYVDGQGQVLYAPAPTPEPSSFLLLLGGLASLTSLKRRK